MIECMEMSRDLRNAALAHRPPSTSENLPEPSISAAVVGLHQNDELNDLEVCECFLELLRRHIQFEPRIESTCLSTQ